MTERDVFLDSVYPRLRSYCREKYGLEFQVVDLNWGLSPDAMNDLTDLTPLRIREIQKCLALSAGPNFIAFIGQKYGPLSLPDVILSEDYDTIQVALRSHKGRDTRKAPLLDHCYCLDENKIPPVYVLKNKETLVPEFSDNNEEVRLSAQTKWEALQAQLRRLIQKGAELACLDGSMDNESKERFFLSELENQIRLGIETNDQPNKRCVVVTRNIVDMKNYIQDPRTPKFAEVKFNARTERYELDVDAANMLLKLKNRVIGLVSETNTIHHDVLWRYEEVIDPKLHQEYLESLCEELYSICVRLIDEGVQVPDDDLPRVCEEASQHWCRCRLLASNFYKQDSALTQLKEYVTGSSTTPLVVYGPPGCGKSKAVSKLAFDMEDVLSDDYLVVLRYIGATTKCVDLRHIMMGLCTQVAMALGRQPHPLPADINELVTFFSESLTSVPVNYRLVIILDGIEQLLPDYMALTLDWIPLVLPTNVKLILTVHQTAHGLLDHMRNELLTDSPESFLEIKPLNVDECEEILRAMMSSMNRSLTPMQQEVFRSAIEREPLPLYAELLVNMAKDVNSFTNVENVQLPINCKDGIISLFDRLEAKHGQLLVSRAFAYMVASSTGLSDCEMEDILSLDEDVLNEVFTDFHPSIRRIPYVKWLSLKQDAEAFLTYRGADGVTVSSWQHDSFDEVVKNRYLSDADVVVLVHSNIADYFLGTWSGRPKPAAISNSNTHSICCDSTDRKVPPQPHTYGGKDGRPLKFNRRMYEQVPRHLDLAGRYKELDSLVFFNYEWLYNKVKALSLQHVLEDFALNPSEEASLVAEVLRISELALERDTNNLSTEISGHLLPYYSSYLNIRSLIQQCDTDGLRHCAMIPNFPYQLVPGSSLQFTLECHAEMDHFLLVHEDRYLVCKKKEDSYVHTFDLEDGHHKPTVFASIGELYTTPNGKYLIIVDHVTEKAIKIHEAGTGAFIKQIIVLNHIEGKSSLYKKGPMCVTDDRLCTIVTLTNSVLCICDIPSGTILNIIPLEGKSCVCSITPNWRQVFCNSNSFLLAFDLYTHVHLLTVPLGGTPTKLVFTQDGLRAFLSNDMDARVTVMHLDGDVIDMTYRIAFDEQLPGDSITDLNVSPDDSLLLIRGNKTLVVHHRGLERVVAVFNKPEDVPDEFKLPRADLVQLNFTQAEFTRDSQSVIGAIFRNVYVWQISDGSLTSVIQGPIGVISSMLVSRSHHQVITHVEASKEIQVWNISEGVHQVTTPDKLTDAIAEFQLTSDDRLVFVKCRNSDELAAIDMRTGCMLDLMTHNTTVQDFAHSPDGNWVLVSTIPKLKGTVFKLWNLQERRVVFETGDVPGHCIGMKSLPFIIMVAQKDNAFKAPYYISIIHLTSAEFHEYTHTEARVQVVKSKPFVTYSDQYLIVNSALNEVTEGSSSHPCIYILDIENGMQMASWDSTSMNFEEHLLDILQVRPCRHDNRNLVAAIFSCVDHYKEIPTTEIANISSSSGSPYGFFLLDVSTGSLTLLCIPFPKPSYGVNGQRLVFAPDCSMCLDEKSNIFHTPSGEFIGQVPSQLVPPRAFALQGTVVLYYTNTVLHAVRVSDGISIAKCEVNALICLIHVCSDDRTVLVGCEDGTVLSYTIIDPDREDAKLILSHVPSRAEGNPDTFDRHSLRSWDKIDLDGCSSTTRPATARTSLSSDKPLLQQIKALTHDQPKSDTPAPISVSC